MNCRKSHSEVSSYQKTRVQNLCFNNHTGVEKLKNNKLGTFIWHLSVIFCFIYPAQSFFQSCKQPSNKTKIKKVFLKMSLNSQGKHLSQSLYFNKVADLRPATLLKKKLWHRGFYVNFKKFARTLFYITFLVAASETELLAWSCSVCCRLPCCKLSLEL